MAQSKLEKHNEFLTCFYRNQTQCKTPHGEERSVLRSLSKTKLNVNGKNSDFKMSARKRKAKKKKRQRLWKPKEKTR